MSVKQFYFRFSLLGTILAIIGVSMFSGLGVWQTLRAYEKQQLQQQVDQAGQQTPLLLNNEVDYAHNKLYWKTKLTGHYEKQHEILIDNRVHKGTAGYHVMTPFRLQGTESTVMVNRGWLPVGRDRNILPAIETPENDLTIHGIIAPHQSRPPLVLAEPDPASKVWTFFDNEIYIKHTGYNLLPLTILLDKDENSGYVREWPKYDAKMGMHIGYAIQWFVFAIIVLVTYLAINIKKKADHDS